MIRIENNQGSTQSGKPTNMFAANLKNIDV